MQLSAFNSGLSGLVANQRALDTAAHNIANASTAGFAPQQASFQENSPAGSGVHISTQAQALSGASALASGTDLATEVSNSLVYKAQFDLSAAVIKTADETLGTLIDIRA
jgi:flagellar hook protein FlgE